LVEIYIFGSERSRKTYRKEDSIDKQQKSFKNDWKGPDPGR
jgi:hypothetical protein